MREETLVRHLMKHQHVLRAMVLSLVGNSDSVDDLVQEVALVMARKREEVGEDTPFLAWSKAICLNIARDYRKRSRRQRVCLLDDGNMESVAEVLAAADQELWQDRRSALRACVAELEPHHRDLIARRYEAKESIDALAASLSRTRVAVDTMLCRLRSILAQCVQKRLRSLEVRGERA